MWLRRGRSWRGLLARVPSFRRCPRWRGRRRDWRRQKVIKVERPSSGDLARQLGADPDRNRNGMGISFLAQNAGKRSVTLDMKHPEGKALLKRLVKTADVVVENFRPGVMDRLGLGYDVLREVMQQPLLQRLVLEVLHGLVLG